MKVNKKKIISKSLTYLLVSLLTIPLIFAGDVNVTVDVIPPPPLCPTTGFQSFLCYIGHGTGNLFSAMSVPLAIFIILMALGTMVGYIVLNISKRMED